MGVYLITGNSLLLQVIKAAVVTQFNLENVLKISVQIGLDGLKYPQVRGFPVLLFMQHPKSSSGGGGLRSSTNRI